ncbi:MAG: hypothetical protein QF464_12635, partial [Myxococcota bacterium]|nr:hypothetical protein [Myxococcota bacterium]
MSLVQWVSMSGRFIAIVFFVATQGLFGACSSGYDVNEGGASIPDTTNALARGAAPDRPTVADVGIASFDIHDGGANTLGCQSDEACEGLVELAGPCEVASCELETGLCVSGLAPDALPCEDDDPCTTHTLCTEGVCLGVPTNCDDGEPCTDDACEEGVGCVSAPNEAPCDDGNACTEGDACAEGSCVGQPTQACGCQADVDCAPWDDADLCNGHLACADGTCAIDPSSVVVCDPTGDTDCSVSQCDPTTGVCAPVDAEDDTPCNDGNPCTEGDTCAVGACVPGPSICQCEADADCAPFEDGDLCNGTPVCVANECVTDPATIISCDGLPPSCKVFHCVADSGLCELIDAAEGSACDDGQLCTAPDACYGGACLGAMMNCDDGNPCTIDGCHPV